MAEDGLVFAPGTGGVPWARAEVELARGLGCLFGSPSSAIVRRCGVEH